MANNVQTNSFFGPQALGVALAPDVYQKQLELAQSQQLAQELMGGALKPIDPNRSAGMFAVPISKGEGLGKVGQAIGAALMQRSNNQQQSDLAKQQMASMLSLFGGGQPGAVPGAAQPGSSSAGASGPNPMAPGGSSVMAGSGEQPPLQPMPQAPQQPPQGAPSPRPLMQMSGMSPQQSYLAYNLAPEAYMKHILDSANPSTDFTKTLEAAGIDPSSPEGKRLIQVNIQKQNHIPLEQMRQGSVALDPTTRQPIAVNPHLPTGMIPTYNGNNMSPGAALPSGFAGAQEQLNSVPNPSAPLIPIKTSTGQDIQLTQPEYLQYQQTGQLPAKFGAGAQPPAPIPPKGLQPLPGRVPQQDMGAFNAVASGQVPAAYGQGMQKVPGEIPPEGIGIPGMGQSQQEQIRQSGQKEANTEAAKEFISEMRQNYAKLRDVPATLENMDRAKQLAAGQASEFMGPLGQSKLALTKFFRSNVPGMGNLNTSGVTSAEELQSTLFNQVMDNLKKMDASPSQYQQQVMQEAFGTLKTDPQSVPKILDVFGEILRNRVDIHNNTVSSAEKRGTAFPYDVSVKLPAKREIPPTANAPAQKGNVVNWNDLGRGNGGR